MVGVNVAGDIFGFNFALPSDKLDSLIRWGNAYIIINILKVLESSLGSSYDRWGLLMSGKLYSPGETADPRLILNRIYEEHHSYYSDEKGIGALKDLNYTHPYPWLYIAELLQNAIDAKAKHVKMKIIEEGDSLLFEHDGEEFSEDDVRALCSKGMSNKGAQAVGFMGIGFKAVFHSFERVEVSSGPWRFSLEVSVNIDNVYESRTRSWLGCVLPKYSEDINFPSEGMKCRFVLKKRLSGLGSINNDICSVLSSDLSLLPILAKSGLNELEWEKQKWTLAQTYIIKEEEIYQVLLEALDEEREEIFQWMMFGAYYTPSKDAVREFLEHRQVSIEKINPSEVEKKRKVEVFCPLDDEGDPLIAEKGHGYALLPTSEQFPFGLHIQADWLLVSSRREIMKNYKFWHVEIIKQVPILIRKYFEWVCNKDISKDKLPKIYSALPVLIEEQTEEKFWLDNFLEELSVQLKDTIFLPVYTHRKIKFISPDSANYLPESLRGLEKEEFIPWMIFGEDIVYFNLLGERAFNFLKNRELLAELKPEKLIDKWRNGAIGKWIEALGEEGKRLLLYLLGCLQELDKFESWREASLCCLPNESNSWISRKEAIRLPGDWDLVPKNNPPIQSSLESFLPPKYKTIKWSYDREIQRNNKANRYINNIPTQELKEIISKWWDSFPDTEITEDKISQVLDFTVWVKAKIPHRKKLVQKVLCLYGDNLALKTLDNCVLADPYTGKWRRRFYPSKYIVSKKYLEYDLDSTKISWLSFFESINGILSGPFKLSLCVSRKNIREFQIEMQKEIPSFVFPKARKSRMEYNWKGHLFSSNNECLFVDYSLPGELEEILNENVTKEIASDIAQWLHEDSNEFSSDTTFKKFVYVPYGDSEIREKRLHEFPSTWFIQINENAWIYAKDGTGPYTPSSVLPYSDETRPEIPFADLSEELIEKLIECGIIFGSNLSTVAPIDRLKNAYKVTDSEKLKIILNEAVEEAMESEEKKEQFKKIIETYQVFPLPKNYIFPDNSKKISIKRVIKKSHGSDFDGWLISLNKLYEQEPSRQLIEIAEQIYEIPPTPTVSQAIDFLGWVWYEEPRAELVRNSLPIVYRIVKEEMERNKANTEKYKNALHKAKVFTNHRKWVAVASKEVFFNDLVGNNELFSYIKQQYLATPGHLGNSFVEQKQISKIIGLSLISKHYKIDNKIYLEQDTSKSWRSNFIKIQQFLEAVKNDSSESAFEKNNILERKKLQLNRCKKIKIELLKNGEKIDEKEVNVTHKNGKVCVVGEPIDFMDELCNLLLIEYGHSERRDLASLAPELSKLIAYLGDPKFDTYFKGLSEKYAFDIPYLESEIDLIEEETEGETEEKKASQDKELTAEDKPKDEQANKERTPKSLSSYKKEKDFDKEFKEEGKSRGKSTGNEKTEKDILENTFTPEDRETRINALREQIEKLLAVGLSHDGRGCQEVSSWGNKEVKNDEEFRKVVMEYEKQLGRFPQARAKEQPGFDIDSFTHPEGSTERNLIRRIEVKGKGSQWKGSEVVKLSKRQFLDALNLKYDEYMPVDKDFDYWVYIVEKIDNEKYKVLCLQNPAKNTSSFELRGGTWREEAKEKLDLTLKI